MSVSRSMVSLTYLLVMVVITSALTISALPVVARGAQTESIPVAVKLHQDGDRGVLGWVFLSSPRDDGQTHVWAILSRAEPHPIHIYRGSCDDQQASPAYQLNGVDAVGESETAIDIRLADLLKEDHVIKVHQSIEQMGTLLSCELMEPGNPSDEDMLDGPGVTANKDAVTYRPPAGEEARLPLEEARS